MSELAQVHMEIDRGLDRVEIIGLTEITFEEDDEGLVTMKLEWRAEIGRPLVMIYR